MDILYYGVDHEGILIIVPFRRRLTYEQRPLSVPEDKLEAFTGLVAIGTTSIPYPSTVPTAEELDEIIESLVGTFITARENVGRRPNKNGYSPP